MRRYRRTLAPLATAAILALLAAGPAAGGDIRIDGSFVSTVAPGTPPLEVTSPDRVENLNADLLDGLDSGAFRFHDVVTVGKNGTGDFDSIQAAIDSATDASFTRPVLVHVGPGRYSERIVLRPYVYLRGSGWKVTTVFASGGPTFDSTAAGIVLSERSWVSDLTVRMTGGENYVIGVFNPATGAELQNVDILYQSNQHEGTNIAAVAVYNQSSDLRILRSEITMIAALGPSFVAGVWNERGLSVRWSELLVSGSASNSSFYGIYNTSSSASGSLSVYHSWISSTTAIADDDEFYSRAYFTYFSGAVDSRVECYAVSTFNAFHADQCPP